MTLSIVPVGLFSFNYDVLEGDTPVGSIVNRAAFLQIKGTLTSGGRQFFTRRESAFRPVYLLETPEGAIVARASRMMSLAEEYDISFGDRNIRLKKKALSLRQTFIISDASGAIGSIVQESLMSRRLLCEIDVEARGLSREIVMFLLWMALIIRKKDAAQSS
jgi:hypothetical protein